MRHCHLYLQDNYYINHTSQIVKMFYCLIVEKTGIHASGRMKSMEEHERDYILAVLENATGRYQARKGRPKYENILT